jgi:hypothetical protein
LTSASGTFTTTDDSGNPVTFTTNEALVVPSGCSQSSAGSKRIPAAAAAAVAADNCVKTDQLKL